MAPAFSDTIARQQEIETIWTDKTETWTKGAGFYGAGGVLEGVWDGDTVQGEWYAESDGRLCENVAKWGGEICTEVWRSGDRMWKKGGKLKEIELKDGKQI